MPFQKLGLVPCPARPCIKSLEYNDVPKKKEMQADFSETPHVSLNSETWLRESPLPLTSHLTELLLSHSGLTELPPGMENMQGLLKLDLSHNLLTCLPATMASTTTISELDLSNNRFEELPPWLEQLARCSKLVLAGNPLSPAASFPKSMGISCRRIKYLQLGDLGLTSLPSPLLELKDLRHIRLSNTSNTRDRWNRLCKNLLTLPFLGSLRGLTKLEVVDTSLTLLPPLDCLTALRVLDAGTNLLSSLPSLPPSLCFLAVDNNRLLLLPSLAHLPHLKHLLASHNLISDIGQLGPSLETLDLYDNLLPSFPPSCPALVRADLGRNLLPRTELVKGWEGRYECIETGLRAWQGKTEVEDCKARVEGWGQRGQGEVVEKLIIFEEGVHTGEDFKERNFLDGLEKSLQGMDLEDLHGTLSTKSMMGGTLVDEEVEREESREDDWEEEVDVYGSPIRISLKYDLLQMDRNNFWGRGQFCPADRHPRTHNEGLEAQWKLWQELRGRTDKVTGGVGRTRVSQGVSGEEVRGQFED